MDKKGVGSLLFTLDGGISRHAQIKTPDPFIDRPVRNLSTGWWMLGSKHPVQPGNYFLLRVLLPAQAVPMRVDLAAVRLSSGREFGLEFVRMQPEVQARLRSFNTLETEPSR